VTAAVTSAVRASARNLKVYDQPAVVSHYSALQYLTPCEEYLFDRFIQPGCAVLDLGVGGGRTTSFLGETASSYIGLDRSADMIRSCQRKFPQYRFEVGDACDLSVFADASFNAVIMAFNSFDYVLAAADREQCLRACYRLLKSGGVLIFSSHNPRSVLVRPAWNRERVENFCARRCSPTSGLFGPFLVLGNIARWSLAAGQAGAATLARFSRAIVSRAFWQGEGCVFDSAHGGLFTHCWTPTRAMTAVTARGFQVETYMGDDYPRRSGIFVTDWFYYVFRKP
jgi:SAM-dependent methyltransferase